MAWTRAGEKRLGCALAAGALLAAGCGGDVRVDQTRVPTHETPGVAGDDAPVPGLVDTVGAGGTVGAAVTVGSGGLAGALPERCPGFEAPDPNVCDRTTELALTERNNVLLVLDASGSMAEVPSGYDVSKREALTSALAQAFGEYRSTLRLGLELFPTSATDPGADPIPFACDLVERCCEMPSHAQLNVPLSDGRASLDAILETMSATEPAGETPTIEALARAYESLRGRDDAGSTYVLLITDGVPNCAGEELSGCPCYDPAYSEEGCSFVDLACCVASHSECEGAAAILAQLEQLRDAGFPTAVLGLPGTEDAYRLWLALAEAGGFDGPYGTSGYFYQAAAEAGVTQLTQLLSDIAASMAPPCEVPLIEDVPNPHDITVLSDCVPIVEGDPGASGDFWSYGDPGSPVFATILLSSNVCARVQAEPVPRVDMLYGCPALGGWY